MTNDNGSRNGILEKALDYAARGWRVIPLHYVRAGGACSCGTHDCKSSGKHPITNGWQNTPPLSSADIAETWQMYPGANVGVATGAASGFFVLDIDPDHGGMETMAALVARHGALPTTMIQRTGSGGYHYFFAMPNFDVRNKQGGSKNWLGGLLGVDVRGSGGQVVIAPSVSGKGAYILNDRPLAQAPEWLLEELRPRETAPAPAVGPIASPGTYDDSERARLEAYTKRVVDSELARLRECAEKGWQGPAWNATTHAVACNLVELSNSPWTGITPEHVDLLMREHGPHDENFGDAEIDKAVWSARTNTVGTRGRPVPAKRPEVDLFAGVPFVQGPPAQQTPGEALPAQKRDWDDLGNAMRIIDHFGGRIRWVAADKSWSVYDGRRWASDDSSSVMALVQTLMTNLAAIEGGAYEDTPPDDEDEGKKSPRKQFFAWAAKQRMSARVEAAEKMARSYQVLQAKPIDFDADPMLLNCLNGVVDLRTGALLLHDPKLMLSQLAAVEFKPNTPAPRWEEFLDRSMPDPETRNYLQRAAGYSITGKISEQAMFLHQGPGANGKSQFLVALGTVLGDYNQVVPRTTLLAKSGDAIPTDIARMVGKRFLQTSETAAGKRLDEEVVKSLTGGEANVARHLYGREFEFRPTGKIHYVTNHLPRLTDAESIWRRLHLFTWAVVIPEGDRIADLGEMLARDEASGILSWLVAGCLAWQEYGLQRPEQSRKDLLSYRTDQDELGEFLDDFVVPTAGGSASINAIYTAYVQWVSQAGIGARAMNRQTLSTAMSERGYKRYRRASERGFEGISVRMPVMNMIP